MTEPGLVNGGIPNDPKLPLPLAQVHPLHEVVKVDYLIPRMSALRRCHLEISY